MTIRISGIIRESIVDGPGIRFVIFAQGCPHKCKGCHNPESHSSDGGYDCETDKIITEIKKNPLLSGVTFSGGEPFYQAESLAVLGKQICELELNLIIYTGYLFEELCTWKDSDTDELIQLADYIIDGKFILEERNLELKYRGSNNQRIIDVKKSLEQGKTIIAEI